MQAVAVGTESPCLVPTARRRCRHPGAISELADLSLLISFSLSLFLSIALSQLNLQRDSLRSGLERFVCCLWQSLIRLALITLMLHLPCGQGQQLSSACLPHPATIPSFWLHYTLCLRFHCVKSLIPNLTLTGITLWSIPLLRIRICLNYIYTIFIPIYFKKWTSKHGLDIQLVGTAAIISPTLCCQRVWIFQQFRRAKCEVATP